MTDTETDALAKEMHEAAVMDGDGFPVDEADMLLLKGAARILADAEVIKAAEDHLVKRLNALQTYFDLSDEELESMTSDERADTIRQHRLIREALSSFRQAQAQVEKGEER